MIKEFKTSSREEWRDLRGSYIGGSDAASVVGLNPFKSIYSLWAEKTKRLPAFEGNLATEVGTYLEEFIAKKFTEETGRKVRRNNRSLINDKYPWAIANIDREIVGEDAGLEIKFTSELNLKRFKDGEYPANYYVQCVHYLAVTGRSRWYLAVLVGNKEFKWYVIERDEAEIKALMEAERDLFERIQAGSPPAVDGTASTSESLSVLYPKSDEATVDLFTLEADLKEYMALSIQIKALTVLKDEKANYIKEYMKDAGKGESYNYTVSYSSFERRTFDLKSFQKANNRIDLEPFFKKTLTRTFKVSEKK